MHQTLELTPLTSVIKHVSRHFWSTSHFWCPKGIFGTNRCPVRRWLGCQVAKARRKSSKFDETTFSFDDTKGKQWSFWKHLQEMCASLQALSVPPKSTSQIFQSDSHATRLYEIAMQVLTMPLLWVVQMAPFDSLVKWVEKKRRLASRGMNGTGLKLIFAAVRLWVETFLAKRKLER